MMDPLYTAGMSEQQRAWFYAEYESARKDEVVGVLLALFLGGFGIHHFYLKRNGLGVTYLLLSWTGIPMILGWIECFFMPGRVRDYNAAQAAYIASRITAEGGAARNWDAGRPAAAAPGGEPVRGSDLYPAPPARMETRMGTEKICGACGMAMDGTAAFCPHCGAPASR